MTYLGLRYTGKRKETISELVKNISVYMVKAEEACSPSGTRLTSEEDRPYYGIFKNSLVVCVSTK